MAPPTRYFEEKVTQAIQQRPYSPPLLGAEEFLCEDEEEENDDSDIEVVYDPVLNCYYDPATHEYYELS